MQYCIQLSRETPNSWTHTMIAAGGAPSDGGGLV